MRTVAFWRLTGLLLIAAVLVAGCGASAPTTGTGGGTATTAPFKVAMVLIGPHDDGGWSQAHYEGLEYIKANVPNVEIKYVENVAEGADSEATFRTLAREGNNLIFGTSFGYM